MSGSEVFDKIKAKNCGMCRYSEIFNGDKTKLYCMLNSHDPKWVNPGSVCDEYKTKERRDQEES